MSTTRRRFVGHLAAGAALGVLPRALHAAAPGGGAASADWDVAWPSRLTGRHRALFDVPEIESGYGVWRASLWAKQYEQVLQVPARELSTALVLRHNGVALALRPEFWERYELGRHLTATHPMTQAPVARNPALLSARGGDLPDAYAGVSLPEFLERGGVALACDLALIDVAAHVAAKDGVAPDVAHRRAREALLPGVILQPSGVFAVVLGQDRGCHYVRAS